MSNKVQEAIAKAKARAAKLAIASPTPQEK